MLLSLLFEYGETRLMGQTRVAYCQSGPQSYSSSVMIKVSSFNMNYLRQNVKTRLNTQLQNSLQLQYCTNPASLTGTSTGITATTKDKDSGEQISSTGNVRPDTHM